MLPILFAARRERPVGSAEWGGEIRWNAREMAMTDVADYSRLMAALKAGTVRVISPARWADLQLPHDLPPDPAWPSPTTVYKGVSLMARLPVDAQWLAAATALAILQPVWDAAVEAFSVPGPLARLVGETIAGIEARVLGESTARNGRTRNWSTWRR